MAGNWKVLSNHRTVQVLSQSQIRDTMTVNVQTVPHDVVFTIEVPYEEWRLNGPDILAEPPATGIEVILDLFPTVDAAGIQDVTAGGLIRNLVRFYVTLPPAQGLAGGPYEDDVDVPVAKVADYSAVQGLIQATLDRLRAHAGG